MACGDHLYVNDNCGGIPFQHHGIDMGDGTVIHLAPVEGARIALRDSSERFAVRRVTLTQFASGRTVRTRRHAQQRQSEEVVGTAQSLLGRTGYSLLDGNCEHFATLCATGQAASHQIEMGTAAVATMTSAATKVCWVAAARIGARVAVRGAVKMHPAALLADGVEALTLAIGCRRGLDAEQSKRVARRSGSLAAVGVGALMGGPVGAAVGLAAHQSSTAIADGICSTLRRLLN